jgi:hypothetical protein
MKEIRLLTADEVECRVATVKKDNSGCSLLLYKDARVDMRILDETFGPMNWQRHHGRDNANCIISVWDDDKKQWIEKEDTGTESNTEAAKGLASDSFKRAGFNWGIGRELYDAPFIWVQLSKQDLSTNGKITAKFFVKDIEYDRTKSEFVKLKIVDSKGVVRFELGKKAAAPKAPAESVSANTDVNPVKLEYVKFTGTQCLIQSNNGKWYRVEDLPVKQLETIMNDERFSAGYTAIRATINAKAVAAK